MSVALLNKMGFWIVPGETNERFVWRLGFNVDRNGGQRTKPKTPKTAKGIGKRWEENRWRLLETVETVAKILAKLKLREQLWWTAITGRAKLVVYFLLFSSKRAVVSQSKNPNRCKSYPIRNGWGLPGHTKDLCYLFQSAEVDSYRLLS